MNQNPAKTTKHARQTHMGKRKLHNRQFVQCDWTGFPMLKSGCYLPHWESMHDTKMVKQGHYANWETVIAAAHDKYYVDKSIEENEYARILEHIETQTNNGIRQQPAPHWKQLVHFGGEMTMGEYHSQCTYEAGEVDCVSIKFGNSNTPQDYEVDSNVGEFDFGPSLMRGPNGYQDLLSVVINRKTKTPQLELVLMYYGGNNGMPLNNLASSLFKFNVYGDCILAKRTKESSFLPRNRYVPYTTEMFNIDFVRKRKREEPESFTRQEYEVSRKQAQVSSSEFETHASSGADVVRKGLKMVPMPGKNLAILKRSIDSAAATAQADLEASLEPAPDPPLADPLS